MDIHIFLPKHFVICPIMCKFAGVRYIEKFSFGLEKEKDMMQVGDMKFIDFEETLDRDLGPVGTPRRDEFERNVDESVHAYKLGEAIRQARLSKNLTQEQLGERIGVQKAQISRLERGKSISLSSITRLFKAMGIPLNLEIGHIGKIALW